MKIFNTIQVIVNGLMMGWRLEYCHAQTVSSMATISELHEYVTEFPDSYSIGFHSKMCICLEYASTLAKRAHGKCGFVSSTPHRGIHI